MHASVNGIEIDYDLEGPAGAPIVMLSHSLAATREMWKPQLPALSKEYRVLNYDMRGHGKSSVTPLSEESRPPSNAAVTFLRDTAGKEKAGGLSSVMADVAVRLDVRRLVSIPISYASSMPCAISASSNHPPGE